MHQTPVTADNFAALAGKMQDDLKKLMHNPEVSYVSGGHLSTVLKADDYTQTIRAFLNR